MQKWKKVLYVYYMSGVDVCLGSLMGQPHSIHSTGMRTEGLEVGLLYMIFQSAIVG